MFAKGTPKVGLALQGLASRLRECFVGHRPLEALGILEAARRGSPIRGYLAALPVENRYAGISISVEAMPSWDIAEWVEQLSENYRTTMNLVAKYCSRRGQIESDLGFCEDQIQRPLEIANAFEQVVIPSLDFLEHPSEQVFTFFRAKNLLPAAHQDDSPEAWHPGWVIIPDHIDGIAVNHCKIAFGSSSYAKLSATAAQKASVQEVRIGVSEYHDPYPVHIPGFQPKEGEESRWTSLGLNNDKQMMEATNAVLSAAIESGMHALLSPELTGSESQFAAIRRKLRNESGKPGNHLAFVQCPSYHKHYDNSRTVNVTYLLDDVGNILLQHEKNCSSFAQWREFIS